MAVRIISFNLCGNQQGYSLEMIDNRVSSYSIGGK
jgi:hypothetical protein